jgi:peroxiredoxin
MGLDDLNGKKAHHISTDVQGTKVDMWISAAEPAVILKSEGPGGDMGMEDAGFWKNLKSIRRTTFSNWKPLDSTPGDAFAFNPPSSARKVDNLEEGMMPPGGDDEGGDEPAQVTLVGKPAPDFTLDLVDGGKVTLADVLKEKKIVVLDFWATWCPPCRKGLPVINEISTTYKPDEVAVFAVNCQEDADTIKKFMEKNKLTVKVPMDKDGEISKKYGVTGIPQTVMIGKDGNVQAVHVGFGPDSAATYKQQVEDLVKGKKLTE